MNTLIRRARGQRFARQRCRLRFQPHLRQSRGFGSDSVAQPARAGTRSLPALRRCDAHSAEEERLVKLHVGCGLLIAAGWLNCDLLPTEGLAFCADIVGGLPLDNESVDCSAAIHVLQDLAYPEVVPALTELRRVLKRGGVLRVGVLDLDRAVRAYHRGDAGYFGIPDTDAISVGSKLITRLLAYGAVRTPFNEAFARECLLRAGFSVAYRCHFGETASRFSDLATLDSGEQHSLFLEAIK